MKILICLVALGFSLAAGAQSVRDPHASLIGVAARQAYLKSTHEPRLLQAIRSLKSCTGTPEVAPPQGQINIPSHYFNGSYGPINPAEAAAAEPYYALERRVDAGMNRWLATGDEREAKCTLDQLDQWAQAGALLNYDAQKSTQSWFQVQWTLGSIGIADSVLVNDAALDQAEQARVNAWLNKAAHRMISSDKPKGNNLHYWRGMTAVAVGVATKDSGLFAHGVEAYKEAVQEIDSRGALPREMTRHENSIHYQGFALAPLVIIAEFAERQGVDLYAYSANGHTLRDAIVFFGSAVADPAKVKPYTNDPQKAQFVGEDFAPYVFYIARFGSEGLPSSLAGGIAPKAVSTRIGGNTVVLAEK